MTSPAQVPLEVLELLAAWQGVPAFVRDEHLDVLASNAMARAVSAAFTPGVNLARYTFLNEWSEGPTPQWADVTQHVVAVLRAELASGPPDDAFRQLVGELAVRSEQFSSKWADDRGTVQAIGTVTIEHPFVGPLQLTYQTLGIPGSPSLSLVIWTTLPGSQGERALDELRGTLESHST